MHGTHPEHGSRSSHSVAHDPAPRRIALVPLGPDHLLALTEAPTVDAPAADAPARFAARFGYPLADGIAEMFASDDVSPVWLARLRAATAADPWEHGFAVLHQEHARVVGTAAFKGPPDADGAVEIAYGVAPAYEGQGYATEAARALLAFAFADARVGLVRAHTRPHEGPSAGVLRRCGFALVGTVDDPEDGPVWRWERGRESAAGAGHGTPARGTPARGTPARGTTLVLCAALALSASSTAAAAARTPAAERPQSPATCLSYHAASVAPCRAAHASYTERT